MMTGTIKWFNAIKNFGFIVRNGAKKGEPDVFFYGAEMDGEWSPRSGVWVQFELCPGLPEEKPRAIRVALCGKRGEYERKNVIPLRSDKNGTEDRIV
jgi:cold shock CspA family protein